MLGARLQRQTALFLFWKGSETGGEPKESISSGRRSMKYDKRNAGFCVLESQERARKTFLREMAAALLNVDQKQEKTFYDDALERENTWHIEVYSFFWPKYIRLN